MFGSFDGESRTQTAKESTARSSWALSRNIRYGPLPRRPQTHFESTSTKKRLAHSLAAYMRAVDRNHKKSYSTKAVYKSCLDNWILPRWPAYRLSDVKAVAVDEWLVRLSLAAATKAKLRNIMSALFNHAMRHEWFDRNFTCATKREARVHPNCVRC